MHDPHSRICDIRIPIPFMGKARKSYRGGWLNICEIWHVDPCSDGSDDSCGRFMRSRHGDPAVLKSIENDFRFEWNCSYQPWFTEQGDPALSTMGITIQMFRIAAFNHFKKSRKKAERYMRAHLYDILHFAENTCDTLSVSIQGKYGDKPCPETFAAVVYGCVLRETRPWWKSPSLHVNHWSITFPWARSMKRLLLEQCSKCGKTLGWNKCVTADWNGNNKTCYRCSGASHNNKAES